MKKEVQKYKMGTMWLKRFMNPKRVNDGWTFSTVGDNMEEVRKPDGDLFGVWDSETGVLTTTSNVMDVQW